MRAASYDRYGPAAEVLEVRDVERPAPGPGEVLVKVAVSGVTPPTGRAGVARRPGPSTASRSRTTTVPG